MAIPAGTTARQVASLARWTLVGVMALAMLTWWWPGDRTWGASAAGLMVVFALWLMWKMVDGDRTVDGGWIYLALLGPAVIVTCHLARTGLGTSSAGTPGLAGGLDVSMLFHIALAAIGIMLSGSLLGTAKHSAAILAVCGAAMIGGPAAAMNWQFVQTRPIHSALALLGFGGVGLWLSAMWSLRDNQTGEIIPRRHRWLVNVACVMVAAVSAGFLTWCRAQAAAVAGTAAAAVLVVAAVVLPARRKALLALGLAIGACSGILAFLAPPEPPIIDPRAFGWFGRGEQAAVVVSAGDNGLVLLAATIGWIGLAWLLTGAGLCLLGALIAARRSPAAGQSRAAVWAAATAVASCALLAPGGLSAPAITMGVALMWGMFPAIAGLRVKRRHGLLLLAGLAALLIAMGLGRNPGLAHWSAMAFGADENFLHAPAGFLLAMTLAWLMGARNVWLGLLGIVLAAAAGGAGEGLQYLASPRGAEMHDWAYHAAGSVIAIVPYLLCMGSRLYESPHEVRVTRAGYHTYRSSRL